MKHRGIALAGIGALALSIPALVIARGGGEPPVTQNLQFAQQTVWSTSGSVKTNSKQYKPIPKMPQGVNAPLNNDGLNVVEASVDMRGGKAKLRLLEENDGPGDVEDIYPSNVLVGGPGASTAQFLVRVPAPDQDLDNPIIQWKRAGKVRARAASVTVRVIGIPD